MSYTKDEIKLKLSTDPRWIERGLIVIYNRQTEEEKSIKETKELNGVGFSGTDSRYLTYCSEWLLKGNHLSGVHLQKVSKILPKYWRQILDEIQRREGRN